MKRIIEKNFADRRRNIIHNFDGKFDIITKTTERTNYLDRRNGR